MKIYFTCSTAKFKENKKDYYRIRDFIVNQGHVLTRDWLDHTEKRIDAGAGDVTDIRDIYQKCITAIYEADLVIIEDTVSNFSTGHQITIALMRNKPTLVIWKGEKHKHFKSMFINGVESEYLETAFYTDENLEKIISSFIKKYEDTNQKTRFNLILNQVERRYVDWLSFNTGKSRTNIIRETLRNKIKSDKKYNTYLSK